MKLSLERPKKTEDFTIISNAIWRNECLGYEAKSFFVTILCLPADWDFSIAGMATVTERSVKWVYKILKELIAAGYCQAIQLPKQKRGEFGGVQYHFTELLSVQKKGKKSSQPKSFYPKDEAQYQPISEEQEDIHTFSSGIAASGIAASGIAASGIAASGVVETGIVASGVAKTDQHNTSSTLNTGLQEIQGLKELNSSSSTREKNLNFYDSKFSSQINGNPHPTNQTNRVADTFNLKSETHSSVYRDNNTEEVSEPVPGVRMTVIDCMAVYLDLPRLQMCREQVCISAGLKAPEQLSAWVEKFSRFLISECKTEKSFDDFASHFPRWLNTQDTHNNPTPPITLRPRTSTQNLLHNGNSQYSGTNGRQGNSIRKIARTAPSDFSKTKFPQLDPSMRIHGA